METTCFANSGLLQLPLQRSAARLSAPTPAAAWYDGYRHGWWGPRFYLGAPVSYGYGSCYVRELRPTPWGPRWRLVNRCY